MSEEGVDPGWNTFETATSNLHASLKWLIASSGAVAALVVAGLQLGDLAQAGWGVRTVFAAVAAALALGVVLLVLAQSVNVLTLPRLSSAEIADREMLVIPPGQVALGDGSDKLIQWIHDNRSYLLGSRSKVVDLYTGDFVGAMNALDALERGRTTSWNGNDVSPSDVSGIESVQTVLRLAERRLSRLESAVHYERTRTEFRRVSGSFKVGSIIFVISAIVFSLTSNSPEKAEEQVIDLPINVDVVIPEGRLGDLPDGCRLRMLTGVAIGGSLKSPTVAISDPIECAGVVVQATDGIVAIPK